ncbi:MAG: hypothetical protein RL701_4609 [Pseudomonadota bacterium]
MAVDLRRLLLLMDQNNPIASRLQKLSEQWGEFSDDDAARILVWRIAVDEARMIEAFFAAEASDKAAEHLDLFNSFDTPCPEPSRHGFALIQEFAARYTANQTGFAQQNLASDWRPPTPARADTDLVYLLRAVQSFSTHYCLPGAFVLVLKPGAVSDPVAYQAWLLRLALQAPKTVRVLLLELESAHAFDQLVAADPVRVRVQHADLAMPAALEELSKAAGNLDTAGGKYRDLFLKLGQACSKQDITRALAIGDSALAIAAGEAWYHMAVPVQFALAAALAGAGRLQEALARYVAAELSAQEGETKGQLELRPTCKRLRMQARLGRGSALIAAQTWPAAAALFVETAPLAAELADKRSALDCRRLAAFCFEQAGQRDAAWRESLLGLTVAREMDTETRKTSTLPFLGEGVLRLCESGGLSMSAAQAERVIVEIAGTRDWRPSSASAAASAHA